MNIVKVLTLLIFIVIAYAISITFLVLPSVTGLTGPTGSLLFPGAIIKLKNINSGSYISLTDITPELSKGNDPSILFIVGHQEEFLTLRSVYNQRYLTVVDDQLTSSISLDFPGSGPFSSGFTFLFKTFNHVVIKTVDGFLTVQGTDIIISNVSQDWLIESSFLPSSI